MHESTRNQVEDLLRDGNRSWPTADDAGVPSQEVHWRSCEECSRELTAMRETAAQLRLLRAESEAEPVAGFYARVMQRIEERAKVSEWAAFVYSPFSKRLAYASLSAALVLGLYLFTAESQDGHLSATGSVEQAQRVAGSPDQQRDAVIVNLASFQGSPQ